MSSGPGSNKPRRENEANRQVHRERFQGPVQPAETYIGLNSLNTANGLKYLTPEGKEVADRLTAASTEHFRQTGRKF